jgi:hypothetical protein
MESAPNQALDSRLKEVTDERLDALSREMNAVGISALQDVLSPADIAIAGDYVQRELDKHHRQHFIYAGRPWLDASPLATFGQSPHLRRILAGLYRRGTGKAAPDIDIVAALRVLSGDLGLKASNLFHYDTYVVTALLPLVIPNGPNEPRGDLVMYPNLRRVRSSSVINLAEKALVQNSLTRSVLAREMVQRALGARVLPLEPGNMYFFWGMRSLHANQACLPHSVRSTVLFHFANPHSGGTLDRLREWAHHRNSAPSERARVPVTQARSAFDDQTPE